MIELDLPDGKTLSDLSTSLSTFNKDGQAMGNASIESTNTGTFFVRLPNLSNEEHTSLVAKLNQELGAVQELQYTTIGPTVGSTLRRQSLFAILAAMAAIIIYLAFAFRSVPRRISIWSFGFATIIALAHDIIVKIGLFVILSHTTTFQFDTLFATALLSTMGYSVSDKVVIFDRIRDNLMQNPREELGHIAERSVWESLSRTLSTGIGALIMLFALFFFGAENIRWFILALIVGTVVGTYSSFFVATPLLVWWKGRGAKK